jgi:hypothetical protein
VHAIARAGGGGSTRAAGWERRTYDVSTAYLQADATSDEDRIPLIYPRGMAKYDYRGNELRGVLISNLYGHPLHTGDKVSKYLPCTH